MIATSARRGVPWGKFFSRTQGETPTTFVAAPAISLRESASQNDRRVVASLARPDRVEVFAITPLAVSSSEIRRRVAAGLPIDDLVPPAVAAEVSRLGLYRGESRV